LCSVNVLDQEFLVRSYLFQEIWRSYSAMAAIVVSTIVFVAVHANPISKGPDGEIVGDEYHAGEHCSWNCLFAGAARCGSDRNSISSDGTGFRAPVLGDLTSPLLHPGRGPVACISPVSRRQHLDRPGSMGIEGGLAGLAGPLVRNRPCVAPVSSEGSSLSRFFEPAEHASRDKESRDSKRWHKSFRCKWLLYD